MEESIKELFNIDTLIDYDSIKEKIGKYSDKKKILFGSGTAAELLLENVLYEYEIECFLDNNSSLWGQKLDDIPIRRPRDVLELKKGTYVVFIVNRYIETVSKQLERLGLCKDVDFVDLYQEFSPYFRVGKFIKVTTKYAQFINRIPRNIFKDVKIKEDSEHIGVVCSASMIQVQTWYSMTIFLILKYLGYKCTLIIDNLCSFDDMLFFEEHASVLRLYIDYIINMMQKRFGPLDIRYIDSKKKAQLDEKDLQEVERELQYNLVWEDAKADELLDVSIEEKEKKFRNILLENLTSIKAFFDNNNFDSLNVITGLHKNYGLYTWEGKRRNMRISTYDGNSGINTTICSTNAPCSYNYDVLKVLDDKILDESDKEKIVQKAKALFSRRIYATKKDGGYNFQLDSEIDKNQKFYDIVMPLNINCDGAALGLDRVFKNEKEWIFETVDYVLKETDATIMIREHPAVLTVDWAESNIERYKEEINLRYRNNDRVYFCSAEEKINSYRMIEKCSVVLPYTSTIGLESVLLKKKVIVHTNVYYSYTDFVYNAKSKQEYFSMIKKAVTNQIAMKDIDEDAPYLILYALLNASVQTVFLEGEDVWMDWGLEELAKDKGVVTEMKAFGESVPVYLAKFYKQIRGEEKC